MLLEGLMAFPHIGSLEGAVFAPAPSGTAPQLRATAQRQQAVATQTATAANSALRRVAALQRTATSLVRAASVAPAAARPALEAQARQANGQRVLAANEAVRLTKVATVSAVMGRATATQGAFRQAADNAARAGRPEDAQALNARANAVASVSAAMTQVRNDQRSAWIAPVNTRAAPPTAGEVLNAMRNVRAVGTQIVKTAIPAGPPSSTFATGAQAAMDQTAAVARAQATMDASRAAEAAREAALRVAAARAAEAAQNAAAAHARGGSAGPEQPATFVPPAADTYQPASGGGGGGGDTYTPAGGSESFPTEAMTEEAAAPGASAPKSKIGWILAALAAAAGVWAYSRDF